MKALFVIGIVAVVLSVSTVLLFNRNATLEDQLARLRREHEDETRIRTEQVNSVGKEMNTLKIELKDLRRKQEDEAQGSAEKLATLTRDLLQLQENSCKPPLRPVTNA